MMPNDFVFDQIYKGALKAGATERHSHNNAMLGLDDYKKHKLGAKKVSSLIETRIKTAVKESR